jgi:hypothetical protein
VCVVFIHVPVGRSRSTGIRQLAWPLVTNKYEDSAHAGMTELTASDHSSSTRSLSPQPTIAILQSINSQLSHGTGLLGAHIHDVRRTVYVGNIRQASVNE